MVPSLGWPHRESLGCVTAPDKSWALTRAIFRVRTKKVISILRSSFVPELKVSFTWILLWAGVSGKEFHSLGNTWLGISGCIHLFKPLLCHGMSLADGPICALTPEVSSDQWFVIWNLCLKKCQRILRHLAIPALSWPVINVWRRVFEITGWEM